jgi:hypothetical protein
MRDHSALKASYTQLAGEARLKGDMVGLLRQQLAELSELMPEVAQELKLELPPLLLPITVSEGTEVEVLRKLGVPQGQGAGPRRTASVPVAAGRAAAVQGVYWEGGSSEAQQHG